MSEINEGWRLARKPAGSWPQDGDFGWFSLQKQINETQDENQKKSLGESLAKAQGEAGELQKAKAAVDQQLADANSKKPIHEKSINDLKAKIAATTGEQQKRTAQRDAAQGQINGHVSARDAAAKQKAEFLKQNAKVSEEVAAAEKMKQEAVSKMADLVKQETVLNERKQGIDKKLAAEQSAVDAGTAKVAELKKSIDTATPMLTTAQAEMKTVTAKVAEIDKGLKAQPG